MESTFGDVAVHIIRRQRIGVSTTKRILTTAAFMASHKVPVDFCNPNFENFVRHMDYREEVEHAGPHILAFQWQVMQKFLTAYGISFGEGQLWNYKPPKRPPVFLFNKGRPVLGFSITSKPLGML